MGGINVARVRDDAVEGSASAGEHCTYKSFVVAALRTGNQRMVASTDLHDAAIDAGAWAETPGGNPAVEVERKPGCGLRGQHGGATDPAAFARDLPLCEEHGLGPSADAEKSAHDWCGEVERNVPHDHGVVEGDSERVGVIDRHTVQRVAEAWEPMFVDVDRGHRPAELRERFRKRTGSSAEFKDRPLRRSDDGCDLADGRCVGEEVLAEFVSAAVG